MTEKVMITQEQADEIKEIQEAEYAINIHSYNKRPDKAIASLTTAELARALYIGYEIKRKYKEGDVVRYWRNDVNNKVGEIERINYEDGWVGFNNSTVMHKIRDIQRMATDEEIKREKEHRLWKSIGREPMQFIIGDSFESNTGRIYPYDKADRLEKIMIMIEQGKFKGFYPAESFISFKDGDES